MKSTFLITLLLLLASCGKSDHQTYTGAAFKGNGYSIKAPEGWTAKTDVMGCDVFIANASYGPDDGFAENVNVVLENLPSGISKETYYQKSVEMLESLSGKPVLSSEDCVLNGHEAKKLRYHLIMGKNTCDNDAYLVVHNQSAYVITLSMLQGESRTKHLKKLTEIAHTFSIEE